MMRLLLGSLFLEVGLVLALVPWSVYWERNYFADSVPVLHALVMNNFVRGAVSGLGLINLAAGITEFLAILSVRRFRQPIVTLGRSIVEDP